MTGDVHPENGVKQKSSSASFPSPQITSYNNYSSRERRNVSEHRLDMDTPEQNPEQMINIGGFDESEANRRIARAVPFISFYFSG